MHTDEITFSSSVIVISKGEATFQKVIDDFPNAERITVVTYNVSAIDRSLLDALGQAAAGVCIICNIPRRFNSYFGPNAGLMKNRARRQIARYMAQLDPSLFGSIVETYFCFRNHAKIVMTENVAYIGSANYSSESQANWECGLVTEDANVIRQLEQAVEQIKADSFRYLGPQTDSLFQPFATLQSCLDSLQDDLTEECLDGIGTALLEIEHAVAKVDMPWAFGFYEGGPITSKISMDQLKRLQELADGSDSLRELAQFDPNAVDIEEMPSDAYEERLETYLEITADRNAERKEELEEAAKEDLADLTSGLADFCGQMGDVLNEITRVKLSIDNTGA